jgi:DNA polymerase/3'-5' exonuclease PolX
MPLHNADIAAIFDELADLLEIEETNPFPVRAYRTQRRAHYLRCSNSVISHSPDITSCRRM